MNYDIEVFNRMIKIYQQLDGLIDSIDIEEYQFDDTAENNQLYQDLTAMRDYLDKITDGKKAKLEDFVY